MSGLIDDLKQVTQELREAAHRNDTSPRCAGILLDAAEDYAIAVEHITTAVTKLKLIETLDRFGVLTSDGSLLDKSNTEA